MNARRWFPLVVLPSLLVGAPASAEPAAPASVGPAAAAWFDAGYPTAAAPRPPAPAGVGPGQLLVEGATAAPLVAEKAVTALRFRIPPGATAATLVLDLVPGGSTSQVSGRAPTGVTPQACPATGAFEAGGQQPFDAVPEHDCSGRTSFGALSSDGTKLVFTDIGGLAVGPTLSVVLRPGTLGPERLVIDAPSTAALTLLPFDAVPAFDGRGQPVVVPPAAAAAPSADVATEVPPPAILVSAPGVAAVPPLTDSSSAQAPAVAQAVEATAPTSSVAVAPTASNRGDDDATRAAALAGLLLVTAVSAWLALTDPRSRVAGTWRVLQALRTGAPVPVMEPEQWGYGVHRRVRTGPPPVL